MFGRLTASQVASASLPSFIKAQIAAGTFSFTEEFPAYRLRKRLAVSWRARSCSDVFDAFLAHEEARVGRQDLAPITLAAHRQILEQVWRPAIGTLPLLAVRYSTLVKVVDAHRWTKKTCFCRHGRAVL
jgi:hypothetical protein